ncbi:MAG TPA: ComF family protein [Casimicrobiaceae bacterium]|nr:ComF family protein [Casimicrobiaceae bacterium]
MLARSAASIVRMALPQTCALCAEPCGHRLVCDACTHALPQLAASCPVCALPSVSGEPCGACLRRPPPFAATTAAWRYAFPVDRLLHAFKYGGRLALAEPLANGLTEVLSRQALAVDGIIPLPLAAARQRERGFNQANEIARRVARSLGLPMSDALVRVRDGVPQAALKWRERARHVRKAFAVRRDVEGARVAIIDDVMTTGATLTSAAAELRKAGAQHVELWVVARTLPPGQDSR